LIRNFLNLMDLKKDNINKILLRASELKKNKSKKKSLKDVNLAMIFEKPSTRTRVSFELAIQELGGRSIVLNETSTQLARGETVADTARVLSKYCQIFMVRTNDHKKLIEYSKNAKLPVINGLSNISHPCQILADILTLKEKLGDLKKKRVTWLGDLNNVLYSWAEASLVFGFDLVVAHPKSISANKNLKDLLKNKDKSITFTNDAKEACKKSDCLVTDTWFSMGKKESNREKKIFDKYQVNMNKFKLANKNAFFLHCLPATRGQEVTSDVIDNSKISLVWQEAENRLHVQKAILEWCLKKI